MPAELTRHQRLAESVFKARRDSDLRDYVVEKRRVRPRWSWDLIAQQLREDTEGEVDLSYETLRQWYGKDLLEAAS